MKAKCLMLDVDGVLVFGRPSDGQHWMVGLKEDLGIVPGDISRTFFRARWNTVFEGGMELIPAVQIRLDAIGSYVSAQDFVAYWFENSSRVVAPVLADVRGAATLTAIVKGHKQSQIDNLLPWNYAAKV